MAVHETGTPGDSSYVEVDGETCSGHALCWMAAPGVYPMDEEGYNALRGKGRVPVADSDLEPARRGAAACPERAIEVVAKATTAA